MGAKSNTTSRWSKKNGKHGAPRFFNELTFTMLALYWHCATVFSADSEVQNGNRNVRTSGSQAKFSEIIYRR